jgi:hypothetical protein
MGLIDSGVAGQVIDGLWFSDVFLAQVSARQDPKLPAGWHVKYASRVHREFRELKPWLPRQVQAVVDIGCGFAGIDVLLARHFGPLCDVRLIDGNGQAPRRGGFEPAGLPWYDVQYGARFVRDNTGVIVTTAMVPPEPTPWPCDLLISLKSWGHHYPVGTYTDFASRSLRCGGTLIIDIRKGTDGAEALQDCSFVLRGRVGGTAKTDRLCFEAA